MAKTIQLVPNIIEALPTQNSITNDYKVHILTVADLDDAVKNISGIINALATLKHSGTNNFLYEIIGEGKDHERLKAQSQQLGMGECIRFLGIKSNKEVLQAIHQCNFVVINSRVETFSVFLGEAMMTGKPAICTACGGPEEFFDNNCGLMIEVDNQAQLIAALKHMIVNYGTYHSHQIKGVVSKKYSKEVIGQQFSDIYETVIGQK